MLHYIPPGAYHAALKVSGYHAVIADERESLDHDLPPIAGIRQGLQIARHTGGEHHLGGQFAIRAEAPALEYPAVFQDQISCFPHMHHFPFRLGSSYSILYCTGKSAGAQEENFIFPAISDFFSEKFPSLLPFRPLEGNGAGKFFIDFPANFPAPVGNPRKIRKNSPFPLTNPLWRDKINSETGALNRGTFQRLSPYNGTATVNESAERGVIYGKL